MGWLNKIFGKSSSSENLEEVVSNLNSRMDDIRKAGSVYREHYTNSVEQVKQFKREGRNQEAIEVLLHSVNATESESQFAGEGWGVAPWYYEQLAILYRKEKQYHKEVEILERYGRQCKGAGGGPEKLASRLLKAKELLAKDGDYV